MSSLPVALLMATGALNVSFSDQNDPYVRRARRMLTAGFFVAGAIVIGSLCARNHTLAVIVTSLCAFIVGMLVAVGQTQADIGVISLVTLIVFAAEPMTLGAALRSGLAAFAGGIVQTLLSVALWPVQPFEPERRVLAELFAELSRSASPDVEPTESPVVTGHIIRVEEMLAALDGSKSLIAERFRAIWLQAERLRLGLLALRRLRARLNRDPEGKWGASVIGEALDSASHVLKNVALLLENHDAGSSDMPLANLRNLAEELRNRAEHDDFALNAMLGDSRRQLDALAGQLRASLELASASTPSGFRAFELLQSKRPWRLRLAGALATVRANLDFRSTAFRHAIRMAVCVAISDTVARSLGIQRSYWAPLTVVLILKPDFTATFSRGVLRLIGTMAGLLLATGLLAVLPAWKGLQILLIGTTVFFLRAYGPANYGIVAVTISALVVFLFSLAGIPATDVIATRILNTALAGAIALTAYWLWPTWEQTRLPEYFARMLDAYRVYFRAVRHALEQGSDDRRQELENTRRAGRLARSNLEAAMDRFAAEPKATPQALETLRALIAMSHRMIHAMMSFEAGLSTSPDAPARDAFVVFCNHVELTLYYLASALRGSPISWIDLPGLREDYNALIASTTPGVKRYTLVNVEADRLINSLNTISEGILNYLGVPRPELISSSQVSSD